MKIRISERKTTVIQLNNYNNSSNNHNNNNIYNKGLGGVVQNPRDWRSCPAELGSHNQNCFCLA